MNKPNFYAQLPALPNFDDVTNEKLFHKVPCDWVVIITDVKGSTKAIEAGRYRDVNTVGVATIVAAQNGMQGEDFPYVFGGDGATLIIPQEKLEVVGKELLALQSLSEEQFGLGLRVGVVNISELTEDNIQIKVARHELSAGKCIAMFIGGGLTQAEKKIKGQEEKYSLKLESVNEANLSGLSCRWNPIPNTNGCVLSLMVEARGDDSANTYKLVLKELSSIMGGQLDKHNPVNIEQAKYKSITKCIKDEYRYFKNPWQPKFLMRLLEILLASLLFKVGFSKLMNSITQYEDSMANHSDFRKFDDMLRMVIDCSEEQVKCIRSYLSSLHDDKEVFFGTHQSENSLMTCFVGSMADGDHVHFIDGDDGGYAMAAKEMKNQIKEAASKKSEIAI